MPVFIFLCIGFLAFHASHACLISCFAAAASLKPFSSPFYAVRQLLIDAEKACSRSCSMAGRSLIFLMSS